MSANRTLRNMRAQWLGAGVGGFGQRGIFCGSSPPAGIDSQSSSTDPSERAINNQLVANP